MHFLADIRTDAHILCQHIHRSVRMVQNLHRRLSLQLVFCECRSDVEWIQEGLVRMVGLEWRARLGWSAGWIGKLRLDGLTVGPRGSGVVNDNNLAYIASQWVHRIKVKATSRRSQWKSSNGRHSAMTALSQWKSSYWTAHLTYNLVVVLRINVQ